MIDILIKVAFTPPTDATTVCCAAPRLAINDIKATLTDVPTAPATVRKVVKTADAEAIALPVSWVTLQVTSGIIKQDKPILRMAHTTVR